MNGQKTAKNLILILAAALCVSLLAACSSQEEKKSTVTGTIIEIDESSILLEPDDASGQVEVSRADFILSSRFEPGARIEVTYTGKMKGKDPATISDVVSIALIG